MVFTHFLMQGKRKVNLAYFNHDTQHSHKAEKFVEKFASDNNLTLFIGRVKGRKGKRSLEEFWRDERYDFLQRVSSNYTITTNFTIIHNNTTHAYQYIIVNFTAMNNCIMTYRNIITDMR